ncbi:hypothetical protein SAMN05892883_2424 [Jatrophihabitans sp. GAS493]|nr:hypothetical protein SAMN05892883_2424 [Jatrophihabitans sp. GAS493]
MLTSHPLIGTLFSAVYVMLAAAPLTLLVKPKYAMDRWDLPFGSLRATRLAGFGIAVILAVGYVAVFVWL